MKTKGMTMDAVKGTVGKNGGACGTINVVDKPQVVKDDAKEDIFILNDGTRLDETRLNAIIPIFKEDYAMDVEKIPLEVRKYIEENKDINEGHKKISCKGSNDITNNYHINKDGSGLILEINISREKSIGEYEWENMGGIELGFDGENFRLARVEFVENGIERNIRFSYRNKKAVLVSETWVEEKSEKGEVVSGYRVSGQVNDEFLYARQEFKVMCEKETSMDKEAISIEEDCSIDGSLYRLDNMTGYLKKESLKDKTGWYKAFDEQIYWQQLYCKKKIRDGLEIN